MWRLRLPLPWPGMPHCNAWAVAAGDGIVLVDTGMHEPGSMAHLERALAKVNLRLESVRLVVCTHAHADHYGQAATIVARAGAQLWMHPNHGHMSRAASDPEYGARAAPGDRAPERRAREAAAPLPRAPPRVAATGVAGIVEPERQLLDGARWTPTWAVGGGRDAGPRALARRACSSPSGG